MEVLLGITVIVLLLQYIVALVRLSEEPGTPDGFQSRVQMLLYLIPFAPIIYSIYDNWKELDWHE